MNSIVLKTGIALSLLPALSQAKQAPKNVIFIAVDDLNDWVGFLGGHPQTKTPNMDRFGSHGNGFRKGLLCSTGFQCFASGFAYWLSNLHYGCIWKCGVYARVGSAQRGCNLTQIFFEQWLYLNGAWKGFSSANGRRS